jgi:hypothetical protein
MGDKLDLALKAKCEGFKKLTAAVREDMAAKLYDLTAITEMVAAQAAQGYDQAEIAPPVPVNLRGTEAAAATAKALLAGGFSLEWQRRQSRPDAPESWTLVVSWRPNA